MTEEEWLTATDPEQMLSYLDGKTSERKLRLFGVACCRRSKYLRDDAKAMGRLEIVSRYADGDAGVTELSMAAAEAEEAVRAFDVVGPMNPEPFSDEWYDLTAQVNTLEAVVLAAAVGGPGTPFVDGIQNLVVQVAFGVRPGSDWRPSFSDIFGKPFRPVVFDPAWQTETVVGLARGIYDDRAFERMPILADALQEAGCENGDILTHCREPGTHVRGCWVVDLVLGKE